MLTVGPLALSRGTPLQAGCSAQQGRASPAFDRAPVLAPPLLSLLPAAASPHTVLSLCLRGKDKPLLLPPPPPLTNGGTSTGPHCNTRRDKMGAFLLTELLYLHLGRFEIHGRKAAFS